MDRLIDEFSSLSKAMPSVEVGVSGSPALRKGVVLIRYSVSSLDHLSFVLFLRVGDMPESLGRHEVFLVV